MIATHYKPTSGDYRPMSELCELWNQLSDVPVTGAGDEEDDPWLQFDPGAIDAPFLHFDKGTDVEEIWSWFEEKNALFVAGRAGSRIGPDHPFRKPGLVEQALSHIMKIHASVTQVVYDDDWNWCYSNGQGVAVTLKNEEDIELLRQARDEAYYRRLQNIPVSL